MAISLNRDASTAAIVLKAFPSHITLWSPVDGIWTLRSNLIGHWTRSNPHSARLRPDGERVASVNMNDTLAVWDVKTGAVIQAFDRQAPVYHAVACDAAGESIVCSGAFSDAAWLWRVADGTLLRVLKAPAAATGTIGGVALSPDGKEIAAGFVDRQWAPRKSYPAGVWNAGVNSGVRFLDGTSHGSNLHDDILTRRSEARRGHLARALRLGSGDPDFALSPKRRDRRNRVQTGRTKDCRRRWTDDSVRRSGNGGDRARRCGQCRRVGQRRRLSQIGSKNHHRGDDRRTNPGRRHGRDRPGPPFF